MLRIADPVLRKNCTPRWINHVFLSYAGNFFLLAGPGQKIPKIWRIAQSYIPWFNIFKIPISRPAASITNSAVCALNQSCVCHISPHRVQLDLLFQIYVRENGGEGLLCVLLVEAILVWCNICPSYGTVLADVFPFIWAFIITNIKVSNEHEMPSKYHQQSCLS